MFFFTSFFKIEVLKENVFSLKQWFSNLSMKYLPTALHI